MSRSILFLLNIHPSVPSVSTSATKSLSAGISLFVKPEGWASGGTYMYNVMHMYVAHVYVCIPIGGFLQGVIAHNVLLN